MIVLSLVARVAFIDQPCRVPCRSVADHAPIFDETYYVGAAHVIAGRAPLRGEQYGGAARGMDPNSEHPQLGKLVIAASIEALGDGPLAWRLGSILAGTLAILGMFALVRAAGGSEGEAAVAAALMAADNLMIVHGRIGTLDAPVLAAMVWSVALYLRGRPVVAGVLLGIGACFKLVAPYAFLGLLAFELLALVRGGSARWWARGRPAMGRLGTIGAAGTATMLALLQALDWLAPPYDPGSRQRVGGGVLGHLAHMVSYAAHEVSPHGPRGIASYPWEWLVDFKPIVYLSLDPAEPVRRGALPGGHQPPHPAAGSAGSGLAGVAVAARAARRASASAGSRSIGGPLATGCAGAGVAGRHLPALRRPQPAVAAHQLPLLHGGGDAGGIHRRGARPPAPGPPAPARDARVGGGRGGGGAADVPLHAAALG